MLFLCSFIILEMLCLESICPPIYNISCGLILTYLHTEDKANNSLSVQNAITKLELRVKLVKIRNAYSTFVSE